MDYLDQLENRSIFVIREAYRRFKRLAVLWSIGKDSTLLLWLVRKAFLGRVPIPVVHIDTGYKFPEIYEFRDRIARKWNLDLVIASNTEARAAGMGPHQAAKLDCCTALKTEALKQAIPKPGFDALLLGIRRDEHGIRAKERYFSPRDEGFRWNYQNQPAELWRQYKSRTDEGHHMRIHPLLHMTELDVWRYVHRDNLPTVGLYFARNGKRYRSIGCEPCCSPIESDATTVEEIIEELIMTTTSERAGRAQDKEDANNMQKLRALGYM